MHNLEQLQSITRRFRGTLNLSLLRLTMYMVFRYFQNGKKKAEELEPQLKQKMLLAREAFISKAFGY